MTLLPAIELVDNFTYDSDHSYYTLVTHDGLANLGYIDPETAKLFVGKSGFIVRDRTIQIDAEFDTFEKRNTLFRELAESLRLLSQFDEELNKGWRNELYLVYYPDSVPYFLVERAFSVLIGVVTYGAHITGYVPASKSSDGHLKLWIPRRSPTKPTFPNMLDNTIAGGLGHPYGLWETVVKESYEEAGISEEFVTKNAKSVGVVQYMYQTPKGRVQPEVEYLYDLEFPNETDVIPHPVDGESQDFQLMTVDEVLARFDEFKPNCKMVIVDFLVRHGFVNPENEANYAQLLVRSHRKFPFPVK